MAPEQQHPLNGLHGRVTRLEVRVEEVREDVRDLKVEDIKDIKREVRALRTDFHMSRVGMSRAEKIALGGMSTTIVMAIIAAIALVTQAPS